jgi:hypothetical protein
LKGALIFHRCDGEGLANALDPHPERRRVVVWADFPLQALYLIFLDLQNGADQLDRPLKAAELFVDPIQSSQIVRVHFKHPRT